MDKNSGFFSTKFWQITTRISILINEKQLKNVNFYTIITNVSVAGKAYEALLSYCKLMGNNAAYTKRQNDPIFNSFSLKPGFTKVPLEKSHNIYKWIGDKMMKTIVQHQNLQAIKGYTIQKVKTD
jgi:hypothetical protein